MITLYTIVRSTTTNVYIFLDIFYDFVDFNKLATKLFGPGVIKAERLPGEVGRCVAVAMLLGDGVVPCASLPLVWLAGLVLAMILILG